jgi:uncharacterized protein (TIGR02271 family)
MTKTVVGTYDSMEVASAVVNDLVNAGFSRADISLIANNADDRYASYVDKDSSSEDIGQGAGVGAVVGGVGGLLIGLGALAIPGVGPFVAAGPLAAALAGAGIGAVTGGLIGALVDMGIPDEEAQIYSDSVRHGNVLVAAQVPDDRVSEAARIMERPGLIDIERQAANWRTSDMETRTQAATTDTTARTRQDTTSRETTSRDTRSRDNIDDETIEIVQEDVNIGKRQVESGGVRVSTYVREVPVEEQVRLREEHVEVERRPVDRPATAADLEAFREEIVEIREISEEALISKEARVVEEVHIHKDVDERTETIRDTARRTEVDVEPLSGRSGTTTSFDMYDADFRNNYQTRYANSGLTYDRYQPAYRYGYTLANDPRYSGRSWNEIEPEARRDWESRNQGPWENFKDSIQYSWDKVRGRA